MLTISYNMVLKNKSNPMMMFRISCIMKVRIYCVLMLEIDIFTSSKEDCMFITFAIENFEVYASMQNLIVI